MTNPMLPNDPMLCRATTRAGRQCEHRPMHGQHVCHMHGGKSPQALAKAEDRLRSLVHPAISRLAQLIDSAESDAVKLAAVRDVLDRTGYKPQEKVQAEHDITITVVRKSAAAPLALGVHNGRADSRAN